MNLKLNKIYAAVAVASLCGLVLCYNDCGKYSFSAGQDSTAAEGFPGPGIPSTPPVPFDSTNCSIAYPFQSSNPATNIGFNESGVLVAFTPGGIVSIAPGNSIALWYGDEHAMVLGIRQVNIVTANGTSTSNYPVSAMSSNPGVQLSPQVGADVSSGGVDVSRCPGSTAAQDSCSRPLFPALFVSDTTSNSANMSGDWQSGGAPFAPTAIYGTWKAAIRTVNMNQSPPSVSVTVDQDPAKNYWNLGMNVPVPTNTSSAESGFSAMVSWDVSTLGLQSGHTYRIQFMVHDGDQNKAGGDVGENCVNLQVP